MPNCSGFVTRRRECVQKPAVATNSAPQNCCIAFQWRFRKATARKGNVAKRPQLELSSRGHAEIRCHPSGGGEKLPIQPSETKETVCGAEGTGGVVARGRA